MKKILFIMCALIVFCSDMKAQILQQDPETQKWGVLNESTAQWLLLPIFDELGPIVKSEAYGFMELDMKIQWIVPVKVDGLWGIMDSSGKMKIKPKYESIGKVLTYEKTYLESHPLLKTSVLPVKYKGAWGIVNTKGKECIKPLYEEVLDAFTDKANTYNSDKDGYIILKINGITVILTPNGKPSDIHHFKMIHADENYCIALQSDDKMADGERWVDLKDPKKLITSMKFEDMNIIYESGKITEPMYILENNKIYSIKEAAEQGNKVAMGILEFQKHAANLDESQKDE